MAVFAPALQVVWIKEEAPIAAMLLPMMHDRRGLNATVPTARPAQRLYAQTLGSQPSPFRCAIPGAPGLLLPSRGIVRATSRTIGVWHCQAAAGSFAELFDARAAAFSRARRHSLIASRVNRICPPAL